MAQKAEVQYVNQFYVFGSEVPGQRKTGVKLPELHIPRPRRIYVDPIALLGTVAAAVMLCLLIVGVFRLRDARTEYTRARERLTELERANAQLSHTYHTGFDLESVRTMASSQGMVDSAEAERFTAFVILPKRPKPQTAWDNFLWRLSWLFSRSEDYQLADWNIAPSVP